jgi:AsmA family
MKKAIRNILRLGAVLAAFLILAVAAAIVLIFFDKPLVKNILQAQLGKRTALAIRAGRLDYSFFPFRLLAEGLELGQENDLQKWNLSISRLEAKGNFWKLVRGRKPAIDTIEVEGALVRFEHRASSKEPLDLKTTLLRAADAIHMTERLSVRKAALTASLPFHLLTVEKGDISLTGGREKGSLGFSIGHADINVKDRKGSFEFTTGLASSGTLRLASPLEFDAAIAFDSPQLKSAGFRQSLPLVRLKSAGRLDPVSKAWAVSHLEIGVPGLLDLEGTAGGTVGQALSLEATARCEKLENIATLLESLLPAGLRKARLRGRAVLTGTYEVQRLDRGTIDSLTGSLSLEALELDYALDGRPLHVRASGQVEAAGPTRALRFSADVRSSVGPVSLGNLNVGRSDLHFIASAGREAVSIPKLEAALAGLSVKAAEGKRLTIDKATLTGKASLKITPKSLAVNSLEAGFDAALKKLLFSAADGKNLSFDEALLKGKADLDLSRKTMAIHSLEARLPGLAPIFVEGGFGLGKAPAARVRVESRGLDIPAVRALARPYLAESLASWETGGTSDLLLEVWRPAAGGAGWGFSGSLSLAEARFNDPSFTIAGEGLDPRLKAEGEYAPPNDLSFRATLEISRGESLWKAVYVPWNKHPVKTTAAGRCRLEAGAIEGLEARLLFPTIGEIDLRGSFKTRPVLSFDLRSESTLSLGPLYSLYTEAGVSDEDRMTIGGTARAGLQAKKEGSEISVTGRVALSGAGIDHPATGTEVLGVDAELPVRYESGKAGADSPDDQLPEEGFLRIGEFRNRLLTLNHITVPLRSGTNAFSIEPFALELYGGKVEIGRTAFRVDPGSGSLQGVGSLVLRDLDISRLPMPYPQFRLTGQIQAHFPRLDISPKKIALSGRGEAAVFGGKVVLRDLTVADPFSPGRAVSLNIDLIDLDLKKLTDEVPFGEVTGIVRGEVRDLVISYGQPERFDFRIESVPRKGVRQTFSLKAVDNLTVLSSGQQASAGTSRFWMRFIRGFRYEKLGIVSTLRNDVFTLNGTIHEGGVEYLVKKPALFGINVINRMPEKLVSFKEMAGRLRRIAQSGK